MSAQGQGPARQRQRLKHNLHRSVYLETGGARAVIVKRFHGQGRVHRWFDRRRARLEAQALEAARAVGLPVPRVLEVRAAGPDWELHLEHLVGTSSLDAVLSGDAPWPARKQLVLDSLAELQARALLAGFEQTDLHAGNVLVGPGGSAWLVDLAHARLLPGVASRRLRRRLEQQLVRLGADVRERLPRRDRIRYWRSLNKRLPPSLQPEDEPEFLQKLEQQTRARRQADVLRGLPRWSRESSATRRGEGVLVANPQRSRSTWRGLVRSSLGHSEQDHAINTGWAKLGLETGSSTEATVNASRTLHSYDGGGLLVVEDTPGRLRTNWEQAARLHMHRVAVALPMVLLQEPRPMAWFQLPDRVTPWLDSTWGTANPTIRRRAAGALGSLLGQLHERGLVRARWCSTNMWLAQDGRQALFDSSVAAKVADPMSQKDDLRQLCDWCKDADELASLEQAYRRAAGDQA